MSKKRRLSDQLRREIERASVTQYRLAQLIGLDKSVLSRFMHGKSGLSIESIDAIGDVLRLKLTRRESRFKRG